MIGYPMLGVHLSMSIVRLAMIGYHCNYLNGQLNYPAAAHWVIDGLPCIAYVIGDCVIVHLSYLCCNSPILKVFMCIILC